MEKATLCKCVKKGRKNPASEEVTSPSFALMNFSNPFRLNVLEEEVPVT
jgi:hypothetical protein